MSSVDDQQATLSVDAVEIVEDDETTNGMPSSPVSAVACGICQDSVSADDAKSSADEKESNSVISGKSARKTNC